MNQENKTHLLSLEYYKNVNYTIFGMTITLFGMLNFVIGYMYFPHIWIKTLSSSTVLVLLGICIIIIFEGKLVKIKKLIRKQ